MSRLFSITLATIVLTAMGCGDGRPAVVKTSGQVLLNGEPLQFQGDGFVQVVPNESRAAIGKIDPQNGTFTLTTFDHGDGAVRGEHAATVIVNALGAGGRSVSLIPDNYASTETSGLTVKIDEPTDSLRIELTGKLQKAPSSADALKGDASGF